MVRSPGPSGLSLTETASGSARHVCIHDPHNSTKHSDVSTHVHVHVQVYTTPSNTVMHNHK